MGYPLAAHFDVPSLDARVRMLEAVLALVPAHLPVDVSRWRPDLRRSSHREVFEEVRLRGSDREQIVALLARGHAEGTQTTIEVYPAADVHLEAYLGFNRPGCRTDWRGDVPHDLELSCNLPPEPAGSPPRGFTREQHHQLARQLRMLDFAQKLCTLEGVERGFVFVEQRVFVPLSYRLMFHANPAEFAADLRDVVELTLRGGAAYQDQRESYEPLMVQGVASIDFCDRSREEVARLRARVERVLPALDARGLPDAVTEELVWEAAARSSRYDIFETAAGGLGVRGLPPRNAGPNHNYAQFPVVFLDEFYLDLAELVLES